MAILYKMVGHVFGSETRQNRAHAISAIVMYFAAGALIVSTISPLIMPHWSGTTADLIGGLVAAVVGVSCKFA